MTSRQMADSIESLKIESSKPKRQPWSHMAIHTAGQSASCSNTSCCPLLACPIVLLYFTHY
jgi:hypothetical protein